MSGEYARLAAGMFAALGMLAAGLASLVADDRPKVEPPPDTRAAELLEWITPPGFGRLCGCNNLEILVHELIDEPEESEPPPPTVVAVGRPIAEPDYDRATIRRFLRHHLDRIDHCYTTKPATGGEILTQFLITSSGAVSTSNATGFDPAIATCVARVIGAVTFPKPAHGLAVEVQVPFTLRIPHRSIDDDLAARAADYIAGGRAYRPTGVYRR